MDISISPSSKWTFLCLIQRYNNCLYSWPIAFRACEVPHVLTGKNGQLPSQTNKMQPAPYIVLCWHSMELCRAFDCQTKVLRQKHQKRKGRGGDHCLRIRCACQPTSLQAKLVTPYKGPGRLAGRTDRHYKAINAHVTWIILQKRIEELVCIFYECIRVPMSTCANTCVPR